ncbi:hypothetical protein [Amycolatopsis rifamycinica]|uniref:Uncharacterized protein n=1 Tax=Amycolatopsis rifamycinica TaxID=287986 RepID=A0A066U3G2_9PSEU|nr:hypothetical protein [Amycolatopsis rifamycinica]KDN22006.1 hypothetical protein DV20_11500 [Amycolatopsis rifamycinica]
MPRRELRPGQVWLIGVPLNLLLAVPCAYPVAFAMLAAQVIAGELGWGEVDPTLVDDGAEIVIGLGVVSALFAGLVVFGVNALVTSRAPGLRAGGYWIAVALLIVVPAVLYWTVLR